MKDSIANQLIKRGLILLFFILSMAIAGQICIMLLESTSNKVFEEYSELDALQEYRNSLNGIENGLTNYMLSENKSNLTELESKIETCYIQLENCNAVITHRHDRSLLIFLHNGLLGIDSLKNSLVTTQITPEDKNNIFKQINTIVGDGIEVSQDLLLETKIEIDEFILINNTAVKHSTITIVALVIVLLIITIIGGSLFIKNLTAPISKLLTLTKKVSKGELDGTIKMNTENEFKDLADSFNLMTKTLEKTTVSKNYYNNILKHLIEPVIVTDVNGRIKNTNKKTQKLLNYTAEELENYRVENLFDSIPDKGYSTFAINEVKQNSVSNSKKVFLTKDGAKIPVQVSASIIKNIKGKADRFIIVAHDLREKIAIENKLEKERKEKLIAINDAHEEEKFRMAIDLHDGLGQILTATSYSFQNYFGEINLNQPEYQNNILIIQHQLDEAINETKNIAHNLIPIALKDFGLVVAINNMILKANQTSQIKFRFDTFNYNERIDEKLEKAVFRIFQEAINNIIKHSQANKANFQINKFDDALVIVIEDDGAGFDMNKKSSSGELNGIGLIGMKERVMAFDGTFSIDSKPNEGTEIIIEFPCLSKKNG